MANHPCECCGHRTLEDPPGGTYQICPVCFWEDAPFPNDYSCQRSSNGVTLREAQRNFKKLSVVSKDYADFVRPLREDETRPVGWSDIDSQADQRRREVLSEISRAFQGVSRSGGVTLHETIGLDYYLSGDALKPYRTQDSDRRWEEVKHEDLAEVCGIGGICFFDPIGWRYHLPAYMTWWLKDEETDSVAADSLLFSLDTNSADRFEMLSPEQKRAVSGFLNYVRCFAVESVDGECAAHALKNYWQKFI